jgi:hypothetical protein
MRVNFLTRSDFAPAVSAGCDLFGTTVQISPIDLVKRHCTELYGIVTESIYAPNPKQDRNPFRRSRALAGAIRGWRRSRGRDVD